jgi:hypothetical protein
MVEGFALSKPSFLTGADRAAPSISKKNIALSILASILTYRFALTTDAEWCPGANDRKQQETS